MNQTRFLHKNAVEEILLEAVKQHASDIIFRTGDPVWARIHGQWVPFSQTILSSGEVAYIANLTSDSTDMATRVLAGKDHDYAYSIRVDRFKVQRFRVNATACQYEMAKGISITMRSIPAHPPTLEDLDVPQTIRDHLCPRYGLVIVTGPVGSGKSTLLFATLRSIAETEPRHIITYEAPIEFDITSLPNRKGPVEQTEVEYHIQDFGRATRNSLRRAGDVILFGESRDPETIRTMSIGAETGVAVYTTAHTHSVAETITRLGREFPENERDGMVASLISATRLIIHQRLVRKYDGTRLAIREWLPFDREVRSKLENARFTDLANILRSFVRDRKTSLFHDLEAKKELVDPNEYALYRREFLETLQGDAA